MASSSDQLSPLGGHVSRGKARDKERLRDGVLKSAHSFGQLLPKRSDARKRSVANWQKLRNITKQLRAIRIATRIKHQATLWAILQSQASGMTVRESGLKYTEKAKRRRSLKRRCWCEHWHSVRCLAPARSR